MDQQELLRTIFPSYGPEWDAAIDFGVDVAQLLYNLELPPVRRLQQLRGVLELVRAVNPEERMDVATGAAELICRLHDAGVEFVLIGGVAATLHGSGATTTDLDVTAPFTVENLRKLFVALDGLNPRHFMTLDKRPITQTPEQLAEYKNLYILTELGRLDLLSEVPPVGRYDVIASRAEVMTFADRSIRVISLDDLIAVKASVGRPKDRIVESELRAIREVKSRSR